MKRTLQLSELSAYLPYKLKLNTLENVAFSIDFESKIIESRFRGHLINIYKWDEIKPILRPMSDFDKTGNDFDLSTDFESAYYTGNSNGLAFINTSDKTYLSDILTVNEYLLKNHFDVFGLIDDGLAISIHDLNKQ